MQPVALGSLLPAPPEISGEPSTRGSGFGQMLGEMLAQAGRDQVEAEHQARALAAGEGDVVESMIAIGRAELSMRLVVTLRNRALEAYEQIMRLQV